MIALCTPHCPPGGTASMGTVGGQGKSRSPLVVMAMSTAGCYLLFL